MNNKNKKTSQNLILLILIVATSLFVALPGVIISKGKGMPIEKFMLFIRDGFTLNTSDDISDDEAFDDTTDGTSVTFNPDETTADAEGTPEESDSDTDISGSETEPQPEIEILTPEEYFSRTLFIGDSRTVGLSKYGKIKGASYFARTSMSVFNCFADKKSETGTGNLNLEEYLKKNSFDRIYILLGVNEIGSSANTITTRYKKIIDKIHSIQPEAVVVIQSNMHVTLKKSNANPKTFNNTRIDKLNSSLSALADNERIFYLGFESIFDDKTGNMNPDYTGDGVHLKAKYYKLWRDYLTTEGMVYPQKKPSADTTTSAQITTENITTVQITVPVDTSTEESSETDSETTTKQVQTTPKETTAPIQTTAGVTTPDPQTTDKQTEEKPPETTTAGDDTTAPDVPTQEDKDYFKDALFIGDSRTQGFYTYGRIDGAKYFARTSMNVANIFADKKSETGTGNLNLEEYLSQNSFGKIYILLGINEIGYSYSWIISRYSSLVEKIMLLQPDAKIIIQSNMHVTKAKSDANPSTFNNNNRINKLNEKLSALADNEKVFYLDFTSIFDTPQGNLKNEYSRDGIHFKATAYKIWRDWILVNGKV